MDTAKWVENVGSQLFSKWRIEIGGDIIDEWEKCSKCNTFVQIFNKSQLRLCDGCKSNLTKRSCNDPHPREVRPKK